MCFPAVRICDKALRVYDAGLYRGRFERSKINITFGDDVKADKQGHAVIRRSVTVDGFDPFVTRQPLTTSLEIFRWYCPNQSKRRF